MLKTCSTLLHREGEIEVPQTIEERTKATLQDLHFITSCFLICPQETRKNLSRILVSKMFLFFLRCSRDHTFWKILNIVLDRKETGF